MVATIYEPGTLHVVAVCDGPGEHGRCPRVAGGERVACAGHDIAFTKDEWDPPQHGLDRHHFAVPPDQRMCPLMARGAYAAAYAAGEGYFSPFTPDGL